MAKRRREREVFESDRLIRATGPTPCDGLLVGEAGGENEHHEQRPFCGKTGHVLTTYLRAANLPRPNVRITNTYPFWTGPGNPDPTPDQIKREEWRLKQEIATCRPKVIGSIGRIATQWFLGDVDLDTVHGTPCWSKRAPDSMILPIYHPAAGFYRPESAAYSQEDFMRFAFYLQNPVKQLPLPEIDVRESVNAPYEISGAVDTEGLEDRPWGLSWSEDGITTNVWIQKGSRSRSRSPRLKGRIVFHNALHDLKILRAMGIDTTNLDYDDTMVKLYLLQLEPQGLKAAAYRHLGLRMNDFDDVVRPHFNKVALMYLQQAMLHTFPKPRPTPIADYVKRKWRLYKPWDAGRRVKSILTSWKKREEGLIAGTVAEDDKPIKLEKKWKDLGDEYHDQIQIAMREDFPDFSIFCVPRQEAVQYSGIDAAATALLNPVLDKLIDSKGLRSVYETDRRYIPFVDKMQETGMRVEVPMLRALESELEDLREVARHKVQRIVGDRWFNPGSDNQVGRWLYKVKGLPILKFTDGGEGSTSLVTLKTIQGYHGKNDPDVMAFTSGVREYRETDKYLGTFIVPIFEYMKQDRMGNWRIHPNYRITRVVSGRNSSHDPNVMAFPTRTPLGKKIRLCFRAMGGWKVVAVDASQIELRMMAHLCRDRRMRDAFERGLDLHAITASELFKVPIERFKKDASGHLAQKYESMRYVAKCFHPDTEVLTRTGWKRIPDLEKGEEIIQAMPQGNGKVELTWVVPTEVYTTKHPSQQLVHFKSTGVDLRVTPDHRMLMVDGAGKWQVQLAEDLQTCGYLKNAGTLRHPRQPHTKAHCRLIRLAVATQADGAYSGLRIRFGFTRGRKVARMLSLLRHGEFKHTVDVRGVNWFVLSRTLSAKIKLLLDSDKTLPWSWLDLPHGVRVAAVQELEYWDSHRGRRWQQYRYTSFKRKNLDVAQALATTIGRKTKISNNGRDLSVKLQDSTQLREVQRSRLRHTGEVACLSVPSSFVLVRDGGVPVITGQTINFAVMYGISARALLEQLYKADIFDFTLEDCQRFIDEWFKLFGSVRVFLRGVWDQAQRDGFVRDMWGRMCYVPNLRVGDEKMRDAARRLAGNMPVQGGARGLVKRAQIRVHEWLSKKDRYEWAHPWLDMHDELTSEVREDRAEEFAIQVQKMFCADQDMIRVPLKAETGIGDSWGSAK